MQSYPRIALVVVLAVVVVAVTSLLNVWQVRGLDSFVRGDATEPKSLTISTADMTEHETCWNSSTVRHCVRTTCNEGESAQDCLNRHVNAVQLAQEVFPPDSQR